VQSTSPGWRVSFCWRPKSPPPPPRTPADPPTPRHSLRAGKPSPHATHRLHAWPPEAKKKTIRFLTGRRETKGEYLDELWQYHSREQWLRESLPEGLKGSGNHRGGVGSEVQLFGHLQAALAFSIHQERDKGKEERFKRENMNLTTHDSEEFLVRLHSLQLLLCWVSRFQCVNCSDQGLHLER